MLYRVHLAGAGFELTALMVIGTNCIGSNKSKYHTTTTMTAPLLFWANIYCELFYMIPHSHPLVSNIIYQIFQSSHCVVHHFFRCSHVIKGIWMSKNKTSFVNIWNWNHENALGGKKTSGCLKIKQVAYGIEIMAVEEKKSASLIRYTQTYTRIDAMYKCN